MLRLRSALFVALSAPLLAQQTIHEGVVTSGPVPSNPATSLPAGAGGCAGNLIDFELGNDCVFSGEQPLRFEYQSMGVLFTGPGPMDGGAVLNECSNFGGMSPISGTDFLAFSSSATMQNGGQPWGPETVSFNFPVGNVSVWLSGGGNSATMTVSAFDAGNNLIDTVTTGIPASTWMQMSVTGAGIRYVVIEASGGDNTFIMDDLCFGDLGCAQIGTNYCGPANQNSSGGSAAILACGSASVFDNSVHLETSGMPAGQFGFYVNSMTQGFITPPGSQGNLCLAGAIGRYNQSVLNSGPTGSFSLQLDLTQTPTPLGPVAIQAGETWNFTAWFRDGNTSNFSDAVEITFL